MVVCGDAGHGLGDSIYEARLYVRGEVHGPLGADCVEKPMRAEHLAEPPCSSARPGSAMTRPSSAGSAPPATLYHFHAHNSGAY